MRERERDRSNKLAPQLFTWPISVHVNLNENKNPNKTKYFSLFQQLIPHISNLKQLYRL